MLPDYGFTITTRCDSVELSSPVAMLVTPDQAREMAAALQRAADDLRLAARLADCDLNESTPATAGATNAPAIS
jgi:hypothetical protein